MGLRCIRGGLCDGCGRCFDIGFAEHVEAEEREADEDREGDL